MTADYNGWQDAPEAEREALETFVAPDVTPTHLYAVAVRSGLAVARGLHDTQEGRQHHAA